VDTAGNTSAASAGLSVVIDTVAPNAPTISTVNDNVSPVTGEIGSATSREAATYTGAAEAGSTVTIYSDGVAVGSGVAAGGNYSNTTWSVVDGTHSITAKAVDTAGNTSTASAGLSVVIDTVAPNAPTISTVNDNVSPVTG